MANQPRRDQIGGHRLFIEAVAASFREVSMSGAMMNTTMHVFHKGSREEYDTFMNGNRDRVVRQEVADDRVLVWVAADDESDNVVFISGYFGG